jgi:hypothetical protein
MASSRKRTAKLRAFHRDAAVAQAKFQTAVQDIEASVAKAQKAVAEAEAMFKKIDDLESRTGPDPSFDAMRLDLNAQIESYRAHERDARARLARFTKMGEELRGTVANVPLPAD